MFIVNIILPYKLKFYKRLRQKILYIDFHFFIRRLFQNETPEAAASGVLKERRYFI